MPPARLDTGSLHPPQVPGTGLGAIRYTAAIAALRYGLWCFAYCFALIRDLRSWPASTGSRTSTWRSSSSTAPSSAPPRRFRAVRAAGPPRRSPGTRVGPNRNTVRLGPPRSRPATKICPAQAEHGRPAHRLRQAFSPARQCCAITLAADRDDQFSVKQSSRSGRTPDGLLRNRYHHVAVGHRITIKVTI